MTRLIMTTALVLIMAGAAVAQDNPLMAKVANKVISDYQSASCDQLKAKKTKPPSDMAQKAMAFLKSNPDARTKFINMVAAPIANKMFDCGMIP